MYRKSLIGLMITFIIMLGYHGWYSAMAMTILLGILLLLVPSKHFLEPEPHPDTVQETAKAPLKKRLKIYWLIIIAGISDLILIILEFIIEFNDSLIDSITHY